MSGIVFIWLNGMLKKIAIGIITAALIVGGIFWFTYTKELRTPVSEAINAIPGDAAFILESKQSRNSWKKLSQNSVLWQELLGTKFFSGVDSQSRYIDSLIGSDAAIAKLLDNRSVFISAHVSGASTFDFLYVYSLPNLTYQSLLEDFLKKVDKNDPVSREYAGVDIQTVYSGSDDSVSYSFLNGTLMMSSKPTLVEDAVRQLKSGASLMLDKNFSKIINTAGKNVDANFYINYKHFPDILSHFISPTLKREINSVSDFADCSGWDVAIKSDALSFSGFTQANDSSARFLNVFRKQEPREIELTKIIPSKTSLLLFYGISNIKTFHHNYKNYLSATQQLKLQSYERYINGVDKKYDITIERSMLEWIGDEIALVITEPGSADFVNNSYAVIHAGNLDQALKNLNQLAELSNAEESNKNSEERSENPDKKDTSPRNIKNIEPHRNYIINYINIPQLLPQLLGFQFKNISNCYYTSIGDYVVFGNSIEALQSFIDAFESNKTLANDKNYKLFSENISSEANLYLYSSIARSPNIYASVLTGELINDMEKSLETIYKFEALGVQFTLNKTNKLFYSNAYVKYNPDYKQESGTLWETKLDTSVSSKPYLVVNHNTQTKEIIVQDDANKLYLISNTGKVLWTKQLPEKIISEIKQVDVLKNNKLQLVFNTPHAIYMFDRNGKDMRGFPVRLESVATNGISVFDYENNRDYRIVVACEDKNLYCFKTNGERVGGFKFTKAKSPILLPVQHHKVEGKDHLIAVDKSGKVIIVNRQGEVLLDLKDNLVAGVHNFSVFPGKGYNNSFIIASDTLGAVVKMSFAGTKEKIEIKKSDSKVFVEYKDITNDNVTEYIVVSDDELTVFSQGKSVLFNYEFKNALSQAPAVYTFPDGSLKTGVVSDKTGELFLFNQNGSLYQGFPVMGKTAFSIGDMNNDGTLMLVTGGADNSIYVYQLKTSGF